MGRCAVVVDERFQVSHGLRTRPSRPLMLEEAGVVEGLYD